MTYKYNNSCFIKYSRWNTKEVKVGNIKIGADNPIVWQWIPFLHRQFLLLA